LLRHRRLETREIQAHAALAADVGGEVHGEAESVVELEYGVAVEQLLARGERALEHAHAVLQRLGEPLFFLPQYLAVRSMVRRSSGYASPIA